MCLMMKVQVIKNELVSQNFSATFFGILTNISHHEAFQYTAIANNNTFISKVIASHTQYIYISNIH